MISTAQTSIDPISSLNWRYATKLFNPLKKVPTETLETLLEALRLSPSSFGLQPWRFVIVSEQATMERLYPVSWGNKQVYQCSDLIVLCAPLSFGDAEVDTYMAHYKSEFVAQDAPNLNDYERVIKNFLASMSDSEKNSWINEQIHVALGVLLSSAAAMRVDSCPMGGFLPKEYDRILKLESQGLRAVILCALGYRAGNDPYASMNKVRYSKDELFKFVR